MSRPVEARLEHDFTPSAANVDPGFGTLHGTRVEAKLVDRVTHGEQVKVIVSLEETAALGAAHFSQRPPLARQLLEPVLASLGPDRARVSYEYRYLPAFSMTIDAALLEKLAQMPGVEQVHEAWKVKLHLVEGNAIIDSPNIWSTGYSGAGQTVAIIDTGIDYNHVNLGGGFGPSFKVKGGYDFVNGDADPMDDEGHGTSVAGIVASTHNTFRGVARDADLVALKVLDNEGNGTFDTIDQGLEWVLDNQDTFGITVANMSIGADYDYMGLPNLCNGFSTGQLINMLDAAGIATFVSAGNDGCNDHISYPACASGAISVGAVYDANLGTLGWEASCGDTDCTVEGEDSTCCWDLGASTKDVTCYSNSDDVLDILAPSNDCTTPKMGGGFETTFGGTSAAAPYSAGTAAVLLDITDNSLDTSALRQLLIDTGEPILDPKSNLTKPLIDLYESAIVLDPCLALDSDGDACDDGDACTENDTCTANVCVGGSALDCDDGNECTNDSCNSQTGCAHTNNTASCDDDDACTENDACSGGECGGSTISCNDDNECTNDSCDSETGCVYTNNTASCDDGNACTENDACSEGECAGGSALDCDDDNACTNDSCNSSSGCVHTNNTASCDDGNACTSGDTCSGGSCTPGGAVTCDDANACTNDSCDPSMGCVFTPNTASCDDGSVCTMGDVCSGGTCTGNPITCSDGNECTDDSCDPEEGCVYTNNTDSCDDGNPCTSGDTCSGGSCSDSKPTDCSDDNDCTDDSCDSASGCVHSNNTKSCEDGNACTTGDACSDGVCGAGSAVLCDDDNPCTDDSCDVDSGCVFAANTDACDDGDACTESDTCSDGSCGGTPRDCDDGNPCTDDSCADGECSSSPVEDFSECDDGSACFGGDCELLPDGDRCRDPIKLRVGVVYEGDLAGHHLERGAEDACDGADLPGLDAFFEVALEPGTYRVELSPASDATRNWVLVLRSSCNDASGCLSSIDEGPEGAAEVAEPVVVDDNMVLILRVLGEDADDPSAGSGFELLVSDLSQQGTGGGTSSSTSTGGVGGTSASDSESTTDAGAQGLVGTGGSDPSADVASGENTSKGCGCRVPSTAAPRSPLIATLSLLLGLFGVRRRRRTRRGAAQP